MPVTPPAPPLTLATRLATFGVVVQSVAWVLTGMLLLVGLLDVQTVPRAALVLDWFDPLSLGIINVTTSIVLLWLQFRSVFLCRWVAAGVLATFWILLGLLAALPMEGGVLDTALAVGWVYIGAIMARWSVRLFRHRHPPARHGLR